MRRVDWDFPGTQDASRSFDIPYTIHGALGIATDQAWLDWHFLGDRSQDAFGPSIPVSPFDVDESTVTLTLPLAMAAGNLHVKATALYKAADVQTVGRTIMQIQTQPLQEYYPIEMVATFPRSALDVSVQRPPW